MVVIRKMEQTDIDFFYHAFLEQGWHPDIEVYKKYYEEQEAHKRAVIVAEYDGKPAGYATLLERAGGGPYAALGYPELKDFNVLIACQNKGIGSMILDEAEKIAARYSDHISLAVGLHNGYGPAQRLYVKRGYIPDGTGAWYKDRIHEPYTTCCNDDNLFIYMSKEL